jgi:hypothetical protein
MEVESVRPHETQAMLNERGSQTHRNGRVRCKAVAVHLGMFRGGPFVAVAPSWQSSPFGGYVTRYLPTTALALMLFVAPHAAHAQAIASATEPSPSLSAQQNVPGAVQRAEADVERAARRFRIGVFGGVGLDPEIIDGGVHATFGPIFSPNVQVRPGLEIGAGEVTTMLAVNIDVLYNMPGVAADARWLPYLGAGPSFGLSHRGFETEEDVDDGRSRFDFSDTDFNGGMNFIVGMRRESGAFFEMRATAWGVSNIRLVAGFSF